MEIKMIKKPGKMVEPQRSDRGTLKRPVEVISGSSTLVGLIDGSFFLLSIKSKVGSVEKQKDRSTDRGRQVKAPLPNARLPRQFRVSDSLRTTEMPLEAP